MVAIAKTRINAYFFEKFQYFYFYVIYSGSDSKGEQLLHQMESCIISTLEKLLIWDDFLGRKASTMMPHRKLGEQIEI